MSQAEAGTGSESNSTATTATTTNSSGSDSTASPLPAEAGPEKEAGTEKEAEQDSDPFHIGNRIMLTSTAHGLTIGRVVYRDQTMVRIMPDEASDRAIEFPLTADGSEFEPALGVSEVEVIEETASDYYVDFLGAKPGELLEFFTLDGNEAAPVGTVAEVIKSATKDNIRLEDGRVLKFRGRGPEPPIAVIRVRTAANVAAAAGAAGEAASVAAEEAAAVAARQSEILTLLRSVLPSEAVEIVPSAERSFPDSLQREDLFQDLLADLKPKQRTNPRRIRFIEREVDLAVALKNSVLARNTAGRITGVIPQDYSSVGDAIAGAGGAVVPAAIPIVTAARRLYVDDTADTARAVPSDVQLFADITAVESDTAASAVAEAEAAAGTSNFVSVINRYLSRDPQSLIGPTPTEWSTDQDVIHGRGLGQKLQGFSAGLPAIIPTSNENYTPLTASLLVADVEERVLRVIGPSKTTVAKTGQTFLLAPSDPSEITGYVMLPPKAALQLRPPTRPGDMPTALIYSAALTSENLPTLTRALVDLYATEPDSAHAWTMTAGAADHAIADWLERVLPLTVHPSECLGLRTPSLLGLLDTYGVGGRDLPEPVGRVLRRWVAQSQKLWRGLLAAQRKAIKAELNKDTPRRFQSVTGDDSPVWPALLKTPAGTPLGELIADIRSRNPTISRAPTLLSAALQREAQGDAAALAWTSIAALDGRTIGIDPVIAGSALVASRSYALRRRALRDIAVLTLRAEPEINPCEHVSRLEAIRNTRDALQRSRLLREFVETYQGAKQGDWMTCTLCRQPAVCYHELMELEALAQPTRMDAIMKQLLIRFGGSRYEGKITCRNCGQGIQDIEYDEHVEFDDEGRAIVESSVLTAEQMDEAPTESTWKKATADLAPPTVEYATESQQQLGAALTTILERGGMVAHPDVQRQIVRLADLYVGLRAPPAAAYETQRARMLTAASTRIRTATGVAGATVDVPTYAALLDQIRVSALMALTAIALQTAAEPPITVSSPFPHCPFSREGWPLRPEAKPEEPGALLYITCVVASIARDTTPWRNVQWAGETKIEPRRKAALKAATGAAQVILVGDPKSGPLSFTPEVRSLLTRAQTDKDAARARAMVSHTDQLPVGFRPEPFPPKLGRPAVERPPAATREPTEATLSAVVGAARTQAVAIIGELNAAAEASAGPTTAMSPSDAACCPTVLSEVAAGALLGAAGAVSLQRAQAALRGALPSVPNAGTHLWSETGPPAMESVEPSVDPAVYFKLFLSYCYRGPQVGERHEFSAGNACRQCGLELGQPLDLIDIGRDGAAILAAQQGELRVETSAAAFEALSDAVRRARLLDPVIGAGVMPPPSEALLSYAEKLRGLGSARLAAVGEALTTVAFPATIVAEDEMARLARMEPLVALSDALRAEIGDAIGPLTPTTSARGAQARATEAARAFASLEALTEDPFVEGPRAVQEYWCAKMFATAADYAVLTVKASRWFKISKAHNEAINQILVRNANWYGGPAPSANLRAGLGTVARRLGAAMRTWIELVRGIPVSDAQMLLQVVVMSAWADLVVAGSPVWETVAVPAERVGAAAEAANWTRALMLHVRQQFIKYSKERIRQILQQRAELERTSVVEEFAAIKDDDERAAEQLKKQMRIGRWAVGKDIQKLDPDRYEFETEQRRRMGIVDPPVDPILVGTAAPAGPEDYGLGLDSGVAEAGYDVDQGAAGDDY